VKIEVTTSDPKASWLDKLLAALPDLRGWVVIGLFALTGYVFYLLATNTHLAESQLFDTLSSAIVVSGLIGGVVAFLFGSSKSSQDKDATIAQAMKAQQGPGDTQP
jgi:hypothetical protein